MEICCNLEVDVNGEEIFFVDKNIIASYSGRLIKLFGRSRATSRNLKLIFHDFPGGAECFEVVLKFCYNNGNLQMGSSNICLLHSAAQFMEMDSSISGNQNLLEQTEKYLENISDWTWSELLTALKRCQDVSSANASLSVVQEKCLDFLVRRLNLVTEASSCVSTSSSDSSAIRFSCDTKSTESLKTSSSYGLWWFEDLSTLIPEFVKKIVQLMRERNFDDVAISKFLIYYQKTKSLNAMRDEKQKIVEIVVDMLYTLEYSSVPCKSLFSILRVALSLNVNKCIRNKLEKMIGFRLDQGSLDNLLLPSPCGMNCLYDVNVVLKFVKAFLDGQNSKTSPLQLKRVARLLDLYMAEVAPDPRLKPSKFLALATALPESARSSYDDMYRAIVMYIEVHTEMLEEEKVKICCALNYEKLSAEACIHISKIIRFPLKSSIQALVSQKTKLKGLLQTTNSTKSMTSLPYKLNGGGNKPNIDVTSDQVMVYHHKLDFPDNGVKMKAHLQGIQWRVTELERVCQKMQTQMAKVMKSRVTIHSQPKYLPWLCS